jgi:RNA polymerase sigma-54 factor
VNLGFEQSLSLQQGLSFQMIQSLKLLQSTTLQLEQRIQNELAMNPLLEADMTEEIESVDETEKASDDDGELAVSEDVINTDEYLEEGFAYSYDTGVSREDAQDKQNYIESLQVYQESLDESLTKQAVEAGLLEREELLLQFLIGNVDDRGYLTIPDEEIIRAVGINEDELEDGVALLQSFDPAGVGARDLRECLMIQLERMNGKLWLAYEIISKEWELFERLKIPALAKKLDVEPIDIQDAIEVIKELDPKPGDQLSETSSSQAIPDLLVEEFEGKLIVVINDQFIPDLSINKTYADMLKRKSGAAKDVKQFIRTRYNDANWLIRAVEQRRGTMLRVMEAIMDKQKKWFEKGPPNLVPLKLQDIADVIEMHVSTISRVTSNKFVQTPYGLFELKYFFSDALGKGEDGEDLSTVKIKNRLREMVEAEDKKKPLSDQKLSEMMKADGFALARRTVAKYREQMGIPAARMRKSYE